MIPRLKEQNRLIRKHKHKKGFTLIELIVVMAIVGILVLMATPRFLGRTQDANATKHFANARTLENASERYFIDEQDWPRLTDEAYTSNNIEAYADKVYDITGKEVTLEADGNYYDIDYEALRQYVNVPSEQDANNYILRNPVGKIYYLDGLTVAGENRDNADFILENKPTAVITATSDEGSLNEGFIVDKSITWYSNNSSTPPGTEIVDKEWANTESVYTEVGTVQVGLRVKNDIGIWSDWTYKDVKISSVIFNYKDIYSYESNQMNRVTIDWTGDLSGKTVRISAYNTYRSGGGPNYNQITIRDGGNRTLREGYYGNPNGGYSGTLLVIPSGAESIRFSFTNRYSTNSYGRFISIKVVD